MTPSPLALAERLEKRARKSRREAGGWRKMNALVNYRKCTADAELDEAAAQFIREAAAPQVEGEKG